MHARLAAVLTLTLLSPGMPPPPPQKDTFGDLLGGFGAMPSMPPQVVPGAGVGVPAVPMPEEPLDLKPGMLYLLGNR